MSLSAILPAQEFTIVTWEFQDMRSEIEGRALRVDLEISRTEGAGIIILYQDSVASACPKRFLTAHEAFRKVLPRNTIQPAQGPLCHRNTNSQNQRGIPISRYNTFLVSYKVIKKVSWNFLFAVPGNVSAIYNMSVVSNSESSWVGLGWVHLSTPLPLSRWDGNGSIHLPIHIQSHHEPANKIIPSNSRHSLYHLSIRQEGFQRVKHRSRYFNLFCYEIRKDQCCGLGWREV